MGWDAEKIVDYYFGEYKKGGVLGKKHSVELMIYPSKIEGKGFELYENGLSKDTFQYSIPYETIQKIYIDQNNKESNITIEYKKNSVVQNSESILVLLGIPNQEKWLNLIEETRKQHREQLKMKNQMELEDKQRERQLELEKEKKALQFYESCYSFHIKETTPVYELLSGQNKTALVYIDEGKALNFLKIDGYAEEESNGIIPYENIHYFEKAGNVSYATDIHGSYSSYGGSMTGGNFSKLAAVGGGLLFGYMGMAIGAALTYKPAEQKPIDTKFSIDSDIKKIDDRSVILNFYSEMKKQYIDIELPQDIYNFLQTYLPEKKYGIVDELEKKTVVHQSSHMIESGSLLKTSVLADDRKIENKRDAEDSMVDFGQKIEKLKMLQAAGLLSEEEFDMERKKLLNQI